MAAKSSFRLYKHVIACLYNRNELSGDMSINASNLIVVFCAGFCIDRTLFFVLILRKSSVMATNQVLSILHTTARGSPYVIIALNHTV